MAHHTPLEVSIKKGDVSEEDGHKSLSANLYPSPLSLGPHTPFLSREPIPGSPREPHASGFPAGGQAVADLPCLFKPDGRESGLRKGLLGRGRVLVRVQKRHAVCQPRAVRISPGTRVNQKEGKGTPTHGEK